MCCATCGIPDFGFDVVRMSYVVLEAPTISHRGRALSHGCQTNQTFSLEQDWDDVFEDVASVAEVGTEVGRRLVGYL